MGKMTRRGPGGASIPASAPLAKDLKQSVKGFAGKSIKVGWFESSKYEDGTPVAYVASIQEFGHGAIPPRPFMRTTTAEKSAEWAKTAETLVKRVTAGKMDPAAAAEVLGGKAAGDVRKKIASIKAPPLALTTLILRKKKRAGDTVTGKTVGQVKRDVDFIGPRMKGDKSLNVSGVSKKPLVFDGVLIGTLTHIVEDKA